MAMLGMILMLVGAVIGIVGGVMLLIEAFKVSILWFIGMFIPFVGLVFVVMYWEQAKKPFLISFGGGILQILGTVMMGGSAA